MNMKKRIFPTLLLVISLFVLNLTVVAEPLRKPSTKQIKNLIKKMLFENKTTIFTGISNVTYKSKKDIECENIKVKKIRILKVGKASSNYYERSGDYINSSFVVKFSIQGSCNLTSKFRINPYEYDKYKYALDKYNTVFEDGTHAGKKPTPVMPMDLTGRVPFRSNVPFETYIATDNYGDWYAKEPNSFKESDRHYSDKTKQYLKSLYQRKNGASVKKWKRQQAIKENRMSDDAERGLKQIIYDRLFTSKVKAQLFSQPKPVREFVFSQYWKLSNRYNHKKASQFLREVIRVMRLREAKSKSPKNSVNSSSGNSHSHGGRRHSHKLPRQGKSHRHGNGPIGR